MSEHMDSGIKIVQEYLKNIGVVHIKTNGLISKVYNPDSPNSSVGTHIDVQYKDKVITQKLYFEVAMNNTYFNLSVSEIRCKTIADRLSAPDILEERLVRDPMYTPSLSRQLPCISLDLNCKTCGGNVISYGTSEIKRFIDIPESNWEEYMDLWHCHKPTNNQAYTDEVNNVYNLLQKKRNLIMPKVDLPILLSEMSMLVYPKTMTLEHFAPNDDYTCNNCNNKLGKVHASDDFEKTDSYIELCKAEISMRFNYDNKEPVIFEVSVLDWLAKEILFCISMYGSRVFKLIPPADLKDEFGVLDIWCLDHGISIGINEVKHENLLKIMYKQHDNMDQGNQNVQDIEIHIADKRYNNIFYKKLIDEIKKSEESICLQNSKGAFNGWTPLYI